MVNLTNTTNITTMTTIPTNIKNPFAGGHVAHKCFDKRRYPSVHAWPEKKKKKKKEKNKVKKVKTLNRNHHTTTKTYTTVTCYETPTHCCIPHWNPTRHNQ